MVKCLVREMSIVIVNHMPESLNFIRFVVLCIVSTTDYKHIKCGKDIVNEKIIEPLNDEQFFLDSPCTLQQAHVVVH